MARSVVSPIAASRISSHQPSDQSKHADFGCRASRPRPRGGTQNQWEGPQWHWGRGTQIIRQGTVTDSLQEFSVMIDTFSMHFM